LFDYLYSLGIFITSFEYNRNNLALDFRLLGAAFATLALATLKIR